MFFPAPIQRERNYPLPTPLVRSPCSFARSLTQALSLSLSLSLAHTLSTHTHSPPPPPPPPSLPSGKVFTFGVDRFGQLGYPKSSPSHKACLVEALYTRCVTPPNVRVVVKKISTGNNHTCTLSDDGRVFMFGSNSHGQLGFKTSPDKYGEHYSFQPRLVHFTSPIATDIACGANHTVAILKGVVYSWGKGDMLGQGNAKGIQKDSYVPKLLKAARDVKFVTISCGMYHSVASTSRGKVWCWGSNEFGQCGSPDKKILTMRMTKLDRGIAAEKNHAWEEQISQLSIDEVRNYQKL